VEIGRFTPEFSSVPALKLLMPYRRVRKINRKTVKKTSKNKSKNRKKEKKKYLKIIEFAMTWAGVYYLIMTKKIKTGVCQELIKRRKYEKEICYTRGCIKHYYVVHVSINSEAGTWFADLRG
jgi:hypothetical protein